MMVFNSIDGTLSIESIQYAQDFRMRSIRISYPIIAGVYEYNRIWCVVSCRVGVSCNGGYRTMHPPLHERIAITDWHVNMMRKKRDFIFICYLL